MDNNIITVDEIKNHLEDEAEFIIKKANNNEIIEAIERMRQSYYKLYNIIKNEK